MDRLDRNKLVYVRYTTTHDKFERCSNPLTIPVYSYSLPRKVPHVFHVEGFGLRGRIISHMVGIIIL